jgi:hypothetical protein
MKLRLLSSVPLLSLLFGLACNVATDEAESPSRIGFVVNTSTLQVSGMLEVSLVNGSAASVGYNLCSTSLEQSLGTEWVEDSGRSSQSCTKELRVLSPGQAATTLLALGDPLGPGVYRVRTEVEWPIGGSHHSVVSGPFTVLP